MEGNTQKDVDKLIKQVNALLWCVGGILLVVVAMLLLIFVGDEMSKEDFDNSDVNRALIDSAAPVNHPSLDESTDLWTAADLSQAPASGQGTVGIWKRPDCQHRQIFGTQRERGAPHQWDELSELPFECGHPALRKQLQVRWPVPIPSTVVGAEPSKISTSAWPIVLSVH